ncbi:Fatty acid hydroxylase [Macrophomina phaseolina MS6]|uniref:Fatty acid hydroxylase n=1 Tax=Macrophomina phaseolina (strain MS6) TaxID=1126212 RepID=K2S2E7_MACPH|nr:Fatty acid hydroxylase [Macrophomina phaseolina MS6]
MLDTLLGLPLLSAALLPVYSNYSTSLNLLFFYLTWSTLVLSHPPLRVEAFGMLAVRLLFYILPSTLFLLLDTAVPSLAVSMKAQGQIALPGRSGSKDTRGLKGVSKVVAWSMFNVFLGIALQVAIDLLATRVLRIKSTLKIVTRLPLPWGLAKDLAKGFLSRGIVQYYIHRHILHGRGYIAHWHRSWQLSSNRAPYSFMANYDHPIAWLLHRWLPVFLPAVIFRFHILTFQLFLALISLEEALVYSGYSVLPSTIILSGMARRVDAHILTEGQGNFAPWGLLDWVHGTSIGGDVVEDMRDELEKRNVSGKANDAMDNASDAVDNLGSKIKNRRKGKGKK